MPSQIFLTKDIEFLYMEFYGLTHLLSESSLIKAYILIIQIINRSKTSFCYGLGHFEFKTLFLLRSLYKTYSRRAANSRGAVTRAFQGPPRPSQCHHYLPKISQEDPKVRLTLESRGRARTLQEQYPGARTRARHQKGAQSDHRTHRYQLDGVELAFAG
jgi:hypothetical protein